MAEPRINGEIKGASFDEVYRDVLFYLTKFPDYVCSPRGQKVKEQLATTLVLDDPRARLLVNPAREMNYGFAVGEFLWYWQGREDLETMVYYNRRMKDFSDDGRTLNSAYGLRLRGHTFSGGQLSNDRSAPCVRKTQWQTAIDTLVADPDSRRAVMFVNQPEDEVRATVVASKDVPCTLTLQFFVRDDELHLHVLMRSNDVVWGLSNDLFSFTLLQECMLQELRRHEPFRDLKLGSYYHTAGSLHIYERHFELADKMLDWYRDRSSAVIIGRMDAIQLGQLVALCDDEERLRLGRVSPDDLSLDKYTGGVHWMADQLVAHRRKRDAGR